MSITRRLTEQGMFSPLDLHFSQALLRLGGQLDERLQLAAALACQAPTRGHVCAELPALVQQPLRDAQGQLLPEESWPELQPWLELLRESPLVAAPDTSERRPLVLDPAGNLYLDRYWEHQRELTQALRGRAIGEPPAVDRALLRDGLQRLFTSDDAGLDWQQAGAALAVLKRFAVISGGPGTGKTTTVLKLLALLQEQALAATAPGEPPRPARIRLLAPTGKAAARLVESIKDSLGKLELSEPLRQAIPVQASTIHRALGFQPATPTQFRHNARAPLAADVVVVDEASMVDLALMRKLVDAVPPAARLILLGDRDQLASVEAGAILGDICGAGGRPRPWSKALHQELSGLGIGPLPADASEQPGVQDCIVQLRRSYRFDDSSGIGALSRAINGGDGERALGTLRDPAWDEVELLETDSDALIATRAVAGYREYLQASEPMEALTALRRFRVLCAHRKGPRGVEQSNRLIHDALVRAGLIPAGQDWYAGRPVIINRNDYPLKLFNGDIGVTLPDPEHPERLRVWFQTSDGSMRAYHPARLPPHETVFAMTVHKSQGSEFTQVLLLLPPQVSPILTRELVYTGVTRAREQVAILSSAAVLDASIRARVRRASGLRQALWGS